MAFIKFSNELKYYLYHLLSSHICWYIFLDSLFDPIDMFLYLSIPVLIFREGNSNPLQYSCLENPIGKGAWWAAVHGVVKSWTRLKRLSSSSADIILITLVLQYVKFLISGKTSPLLTTLHCHTFLDHSQALFLYIISILVQF